MLAENKLFATLGTSVGRMNLRKEETGEWGEYQGQEVLVNDTIGFIRDLPPELIKAFSSTLEDSVEADILLHVIDASDPQVLDKIDIVDTTLESIGAEQPRIYVFNKIDNMSDLALLMAREQFADFCPVFISAVDGR